MVATKEASVLTELILGFSKSGMSHRHFANEEAPQINSDAGVQSSTRSFRVNVKIGKVNATNFAWGGPQFDKETEEIFEIPKQCEHAY